VAAVAPLVPESEEAYLEIPEVASVLTSSPCLRRRGYERYTYVSEVALAMYKEKEE